MSIILVKENFVWGGRGWLGVLVDILICFLIGWFMMDVV